jgi:hypothetical protein
MKSFQFAASAVVLALAFASTSQAEEAAAQASVEEKNTFIENFRLSYAASIATDSVSTANTADGAPYLFNSLNAGYMVTPAYRVFVNPRFNIRPFPENKFDMSVVRIGVGNSSIFKNDDMKFGSIFRFEVPVSPGAIAKKTFVGTSLVPTISTTQGIVTVAAEGLARYNFFSGSTAGLTNSAGAPIVQTDLDLILSPSVSVQVLDPLAVFTSADLQAYHNRELNVAAEGAWNTPIDWQVIGLSWDVLPKLNLSTYVNVAAKEIKIQNTGFYIDAALTIF